MGAGGAVLIGEGGGENAAGPIPVDPKGDITVRLGQGAGGGQLGVVLIGDLETLAAIAHLGIVQGKGGVLGGETRVTSFKVREKGVLGGGGHRDGDGDCVAARGHLDFTAGGVASRGEQAIRGDGADGGIGGPGKALVLAGEVDGFAGGGRRQVDLLSRGEGEGGDVLSGGLIGDIDVNRIYKNF